MPTNKFFTPAMSFISFSMRVAHVIAFLQTWSILYSALFLTYSRIPNTMLKTIFLTHRFNALM